LSRGAIADDLNPHWGTIPAPVDAWGLARISLPSGFKLCSIVESYSRWIIFYVFVDPKLRCEDPRWARELDNGPYDLENMPDAVSIAGVSDTAFEYNSTDDYVKADSFYCHGLSDDKDHHPITKAPTSIMHVGKILAGLDTVACTREDERGRYSKAYLAYRPDPDGVGDNYKIAVYAHRENKRQADKLLDQITRAFKLLP
jgi:hypothetical protein